MTTPQSDRDRRPTQATTGTNFRPSATWTRLQLRAELLRRVRSFFDQRGYLEVETPLLSADVVVDRHLDPFTTTLAYDPRRPYDGCPLWLQTSPEFAMKRLLAAGSPSIYQIAKAFRNGEQGPLHNPEFTLVEWYGLGDDMPTGIQLLSDLADVLLERGPADALSYADAFARHLDLNPHLSTAAELCEVCRKLGLSHPATLSLDDRDGWLDYLLVERIEPYLGREHPTILYDYPVSQAALAQVSQEDVPVARRFELYVDGIELANGYHELLDAQVLRDRNIAANAARNSDGKIQLPVESRLLEAMSAGLPPCTGVALGFDRVVMLVAGARTLREVLAFPIDLA